MYHSTTGLPHLVPPKAYTAPESFAAESKGLLRSAWHFVATLDQLSKTGDFVTFALLSNELQLRNFNGMLKAFSNVCVHRHCLLTDCPSGNTAAMRCQYHAWEYGEDGFTRRVPEAKNFAPIDRSKWRLPEYRVQTIGKLVFVCLDSQAPDLVEFLGPVAGLVAERFSEENRCWYRRDWEYQANWKVAIENSLEAYHVAAIHAETFGDSPSEERTEHQLNPRHTAFLTDLPFRDESPADKRFHRWEKWSLKRLGIQGNGQYQQHHVFPNLLFSFTDAVSLVHSVDPLAVDRSRSKVRQFGPCPKSVGRLKRRFAAGLGKMEGMILDRIMKEDVELYPLIQRGLASSPHRGVLSRAEERIHAFHQFLLQSQYQTY
jgi:phenylpropionate dioxygenase-like ring-hydroxylating dioxygenase large terminal subunit